MLEKVQSLFQFIEEIDQLKTIQRRTKVISQDRYENSAEHSWHLALSVYFLADLSDKPIDILKSVKMALIHDLVEIYAGDTFFYDVEKQKEKEEKELAAAKTLFLSDENEIKKEFHALWMEYEEHKTNEAKFVASLDRLLPLYTNYKTKGHSWRENKITKQMVLEKNQSISEGSKNLGEFAKHIIEDADRQGYFNFKE